MWLKSVIIKELIFIYMFEQLNLTSTKVIIKFRRAFIELMIINNLFIYLV